MGPKTDQEGDFVQLLCSTRSLPHQWECFSQSLNSDNVEKYDQDGKKFVFFIPLPTIPILLATTTKKTNPNLTVIQPKYFKYWN